MCILYIDVCIYIALCSVQFFAPISSAMIRFSNVSSGDIESLCRISCKNRSAHRGKVNVKLYTSSRNLLRCFLPLLACCFGQYYFSFANIQFMSSFFRRCICLPVRENGELPATYLCNIRLLLQTSLQTF